MLSTIQSIFYRTDANHQPKYVSAIGFLSLLVYAFTRTSDRYLAENALAISGTLGLWGIYKYGKQVRSRPLFLIVAVSILVQCIPWALSHYSHPEWAEKNMLIDYLSRWLIFIPLAWWVAQYKHGIWVLYMVAASAILLSPWVTGYGIQEIIDGLHGKRIDFDLQNAQHTSLFFSVVAIGLVCFLPRLYRLNKLAAFIGICVICYCLIAVVISASRQAWLALAVTSFVFTLIYIGKVLATATPTQKIKAIIGVVIVGSIVAIGVVNSTAITKRLGAEQKTIAAILAIDFEHIPYSSIGIRVNTWRAAAEFISEKPVFGWGSNGMTLVVKKTEWLPNNVKKHFGHLHNSYIEITVNYGAMGFLFYLLTWAYFTKQTLRRVRTKKLPKDIGYFYLSFLCFWSVMICFEAYQNYWTGTLCLHVILAGILGKIWQDKLNHRCEVTPS